MRSINFKRSQTTTISTSSAPTKKRSPARQWVFKPYPWQVEVTGLVDKPLRLSLEDIYQRYPQEERIYRLRCVEGWSMVIPWVGFPISALLNDAALKPEAQFVRFVTVYRPEEMRRPAFGDPAMALSGRTAP